MWRYADGANPVPLMAASFASNREGVAALRVRLKRDAQGRDTSSVGSTRPGERRRLSLGA